MSINLVFGMPWEKIVFESNTQPEQGRTAYKIYYKMDVEHGFETHVVEIHKTWYPAYPDRDRIVTVMAVWYESGETCLRIAKTKEAVGGVKMDNIVYLCVNDYSYERPQFFNMDVIENIKDDESLKKYLELIEEHIGLAIDKIYESMMP